MSNVLSDLFFPQSADQVGTNRVEAINNQPYDVQVRNAGSSVVDVMLSAGQDKLVELASGTAVGQSLIQTAQQQQLAKWTPLLLIGGLVLVLILAFGRRG